MRLPSSPRRGVSLLEALLAVTILFISVFAISQLMDSSNRQANQVRDRSRGMQLAQSKLKEFEAGIQPLSGGGSGTFEEDPAWEWSVDAESNTEITGLWNVTVRVKRQNSNTIAASLSQIVIDPSSRGNSTDAAQISGSSSSSSSNSSSSPSSTTTPSTPATGGAAPAGGATSKPAGGTTAPAGGTARPSGGTAPAGGTGRPSGTTTPPASGGRTGTSGAGGK